MSVNPIKNLYNIISNINQQSNDLGSEITKIYAAKNNPPKGLAVAEERHVINEIRKIEKEDSQVTAPDNSSDEVVIDDPVQPPVSNNTSSEYSLEDLATLYVKQYEDNSGTKLSSEDFNKKVSEVTSLYGELKNGQERLDTIVFANDGDIEVA